MAKTLCELKKAFKAKKLGEYRKLVDDPCVLCAKCGRVANKKKYVCKPRRLSRKLRKKITAAA